MYQYSRVRASPEAVDGAASLIREGDLYLHGAKMYRSVQASRCDATPQRQNFPMR